MREQFKTNYIFNSDEKDIPQKRTRKIFKRMNSLKESDILRPQLKFVVNGGQVDTEFRDTYQYKDVVSRARYSNEQILPDSSVGQARSATQNVWSIDENENDTSVIMNTLLIEDNNTVNEYTDTNDNDPTLNTLSAEIDSAVSNDLSEVNNDNFDMAVKGETLENDGYDKFNDADARLPTNDDILEISKTSDYSTEEKVALQSDIPKSADHEVAMNEYESTTTTTIAAYEMIDNNNNQQNLQTDHAKNPRIEFEKNPSNNIEENPPTTIRNNIMDFTIEAAIMENNNNDNIAINNDNLFEESSHAPIITTVDSHDYTNYDINGKITHNENENTSGTQNFAVADNQQLPESMYTTQSLSTFGANRAASSTNTQTSVGKNSELLLHTSTESENIDYNTGKTYGELAEQIYGDSLQNKEVEANNSNQRMPEATTDANLPPLAIKNNAKNDYEMSYINNDLEKAETKSQTDDFYEFQNRESDIIETDNLYDIIENVVAKQERKSLVDSIYSWLSNSYMINNDDIYSNNYNTKRTDNGQNFLHTNIDRSQSYNNIKGLPFQHFQQSHFMPMFPMVSYPSYPYQLQQNVHQVHQNVHNGHQHVHNEHQYEHPVQQNVHSVHQKIVQGANHEIAPTVPNVPGVHPSVPYVLVPVIHVPYVYHPPVYNYNLPNVHLNDSQ